MQTTTEMEPSLSTLKSSWDLMGSGGGLHADGVPPPHLFLYPLNIACWGSHQLLHSLYPKLAQALTACDIYN